MKQTQEEKKKTNLNSVVGVENGSLFVLTEKRINETYQQSMNPPLNALSFIKFRNKFAYEFFMRFVFYFRVEMEADRMVNRVLVSNISKKGLFSPSCLTLACRVRVTIWDAYVCRIKSE